MSSVVSTPVVGCSIAVVFDNKIATWRSIAEKTSTAAAAAVAVAVAAAVGTAAVVASTSSHPAVADEHWMGCCCIGCIAHATERNVDVGVSTLAGTVAVERMASTEVGGGGGGGGAVRNRTNPVAVFDSGVVAAWIRCHCLLLLV